jgi:hypothetical protein
VLVVGLLYWSTRATQTYRGVTPVASFDPTALTRAVSKYAVTTKPAAGPATVGPTKRLVVDAVVVAPVRTGVTGIVALRWMLTPAVWSTVYFAVATPAAVATVRDWALPVNEPWPEVEPYPAGVTQAGRWCTQSWNVTGTPGWVPVPSAAVNVSLVPTTGAVPLLAGVIAPTTVVASVPVKMVPLSALTLNGLPAYIPLITAVRIDWVW